MEQQSNAIVNVLGVPFLWKTIERKDFEKYSILSTYDAKAVYAWLTSSSHEKTSVVTLYDYGDNKNLVEELAESFEEIATHTELQAEYNLFPVVCELVKFDKKKKIFFCAVKPKNSGALVSVDIYFVYEDKTYSLHTVIEKMKGNNFQEVVSQTPKVKNIVDIIKSIK